MTWPVLLAHWTAFAQSSLALPKNADGERWRATVAPIIGLQAVTFALGDLDTLTLPGERAAGLDKAEVLVRSHTGALHALWRGEAMPDELAALVHDANAALHGAREGGLEWRVGSEKLVAQHPGDLLDEIVAAGFAGDLYMPVPGTALFKGSPCAFMRGAEGERPQKESLAMVTEFLGEVSGPERIGGMRQVYRQFDFGAGGVKRDYVVKMDGPLTPGQAQLIPVIEHGRVLAVHLPIPGMANLQPVPVVFAADSDPESP